MFFCVHLPGLVGPGRAGQVDPRPPPRLRRCEAGGREGALECPLRGDGPPRRRLEQMDPDQAGPPGGMLASQSQGGLGQLGGGFRGGGGAAIVGSDRLGTATAEPAEEAANRRGRQPERRGDLAGPLTLLVESEDGLADRCRDGTWHGRTSRGSHQETIPHSAPMSRRDQTSCRD
jgi:hypothetical protein